MNNNGTMIMISMITPLPKVINSIENKKTKRHLEISKYQSCRVKRLLNLP